MKKLEFVTGNFGLKILALALAIIIYHVLKDSAADDGDATNNIHDRTAFTAP